MDINDRRRLRTIRLLTAVIFVGLVISGLTAFPLKAEIDLATRFLFEPGDSLEPHRHDGFHRWILFIRQGIHETYRDYPFMAYGTDWLAFAHLVIALFYLPVFRDPRRYIANLYIGAAACFGVFAIAFIFGPIRGIPLYWRFIDAAFGLVALIPFLLAIHLTRRLPAPRVHPSP